MVDRTGTQFPNWYGSEILMELYTLSTGDIAYRYEKSIVVVFKGKRRVLSTSLFNGGVREDLKYVFNHDENIGAGMACTLSAPTLEGHMANIAKKLGLDIKSVTGMSTAAYMENVSIVTEAYEQLTITALVTGGIEVNGGRVGDPATYFKPLKQGDRMPVGTINIMLFIDGELNPGTMARALVTCTEAKTAALQELMAGSNYSTGIATGSGTDQTIVVCNCESPWYYEGAGKHNKVGEYIGRVVKRAVKEALYKQTRLCPRTQHNALHRLKRYGLTADSLFNSHIKAGGDLEKFEFATRLDGWVKSDNAVVRISSLIHLLDQWQWELLSQEEVAFGFTLILEKENTLAIADNLLEAALEEVTLFILKELNPQN